MPGINALISGIATQTSSFRLSSERKETKQQPKQDDDAVRITLSRQTSPASENASDIAKSVTNPAGNLRGYAKALTQTPTTSPDPKPVQEAVLAKLPDVKEATSTVLERVNEAPESNEGKPSSALAAKGQLVNVEA